MEAFRQKPGGYESKRLRKGMVEALPRCPKSSRSCFVGSASASAGKISTLVERTRMAEGRQKAAGFFRLTGRVALALRERNIEPPILLPANHRIVFNHKDRHYSLHHAGVKTTLSELKKKFWIVKDASRLRRCGSHVFHAKSCLRHLFKSWQLHYRLID